ncbi:hypothetical protein ACHAWU_003177 [Discostella pseudostelligera]|uniref:Uncharacterized protein n=1 Tax=Discostella pseudostelligera TaxID=259834 RepID=A0ABD3M4E7_9STRA
MSSFRMLPSTSQRRHIARQQLTDAKAAQKFESSCGATNKAKILHCHCEFECTHAIAQTWAKSTRVDTTR